MSDVNANLENTENAASAGGIEDAGCTDKVDCAEQLQNVETKDDADAPEACAQRSEAPTLSPEHQQIRKWLEDASSAHRGDVYSGKRDGTRFKKPIQLDAKLFDAEESRTVMATMHNISCTGIAFWVRGEVELGTIVQLRECDPTNRISWVSATITHCRRGLRGFVVGARFQTPLADPPPSWDESMADFQPALEQPELVEPADPKKDPKAIGATGQTGTAEPHEEEKGESDRGILSWFGLG